MLEDWGFKKVENADDYKFYCHASLKDHIPFKAKNLTTDYENYSNEGIVDLITCDCGNLILKRCSINDFYFNWYTPNVSEEDIQAIYTLRVTRPYLTNHFDKHILIIKNVRNICFFLKSLQKKKYGKSTTKATKFGGSAMMTV